MPSLRSAFCRDWRARWVFSDFMRRGGRGTYPQRPSDGYGYQYDLVACQRRHVEMKHVFARAELCV